MNDAPQLEPDMALFLDFDGTLTELAPRPEEVQVASEVVSSLQHLQTGLEGAVAVISGRPIAQIDDFLAPLHLPAAGLHGLEHRMAADRDVLRDAPSPDIRALKGLLKNADILKRGATLEDKGPAVAMHYRAAPALEAEVVALMKEALKALPALHLVHGKMVVEAKPFSSDKGYAVRAFLEQPPFKGRRPVFIGDDVTDEDGIAAAQEAGGFGIKVGAGNTGALHRLKDVAAVHDWLAGRMTVSET
ncbi:trehalose-phosphatase [Labrenzia sp. CE80]|uniref:trehalose-phosphatase n=1 Tax=Labrenzia sp. CE80 TaxID=1788986 RepID=UPI00129B0C55|nr:trehalose-phosphatase [Labrenzia sp. CE80]